MEELLYLALAIVYWRCLVTTAGGAIVAFVFVHYVPGFSPLQGIAFLVIGLILGAVWDEKKRFDLVSTAKTTTALPVLILAAFLGGSVWGFFSSDSVTSAGVGVGLLLVFFAAWRWYLVTHETFETAHFRSALTTAVLGFGISIYSLLPLSPL